MNTVLTDFGKKVRCYRLKKKLSQEKLAELAYLHRTYVAQVESGKRNISLLNVKKLSKALNIAIKHLF